jgi:hypothetical protein
MSQSVGNRCDRLMDCIGDDVTLERRGLHSNGDCTGICTTFLYFKFKELQISLAPFPSREKEQALG